jgi:tripartite-type tricarboxylate transporter receptor subunit TctC
MSIKRTLACLFAVSTFAGIGTAAADPIADFYKGKQMRLVIHVTPGGGYDSYARLMGKHITKHIPGHPGLVANNMPGGGGLRAVNYIGNVAPKDGTLISIISQGLPLYQAMSEIENKKDLEIDLDTFGWIGNLSDSNQLLVTYGDAPVKTIDEARTREAIIGSTGMGSISVQLPTLMNNIVGTKFKIVYGYPGGAEINLAMERGEVHGRGANPWASYKSTTSAWVAEKKLNYIVQVGLKREEELPNVPLLTELATNDLDRAALDVISKVAAFGRSVATTPGVPSERVAALRQAFDATMKDPDFIAEAAKAKMEIGYMSGSQVESLVKDIVKAPRPVIERLVAAMEAPKDAKKVTADKK